MSPKMCCCTSRLPMLLTFRLVVTLFWSQRTPNVPLTSV
jgi:hypothetical protein